MSKIPGTLVYHLPFKRFEYKTPEITLVVRKGIYFINKGDIFTAGLSVCSKGDQFSKKIGLTRANGRLRSLQWGFQSFTVEELLRKIKTRLHVINGIHGNLSFDTFNDLDSPTLIDRIKNMKALSNDL